MPSLAPRLALAPLLMLSACATTVHELPSSYSPPDLPEAVVIGRLEVELAGPTENAEPIGFFKNLTHMHLTVHNESNDESYEIVCEEGGYHVPFHVALPPGEYTLDTVKINNLQGSPTGAFTVPSGGIVYIGTLRYAKGSFGKSIAITVLSGGAFFDGHWVVEDHSEEAIATFRARFPQLDAPVDASLIRLEP